MGTIKLTREEAQQIVDAYAEHGENEKAAASLGLHETSFRRRLKLAKEMGVVSKIDSPRALKQQIATLKKQVEAASKDEDTAERIRRAIYNLSDHTPQPPKWLKSPRKGTGSRGCPMTLWSDWHYGEVVKKDEVGGVNEFNADIARERVKRLVDTTSELCMRHMGDA